MLQNEANSFSLFKKNGRLMDGIPKVNKALEDLLNDIHLDKHYQKIQRSMKENRSV